MNYLTAKQRNKVFGVYERRKKQALQVGGIFQMNYSDCLEYLKIQNDTFHRPVCSVLKIEGNMVYIDAVFYGSGLFTHPRRFAWVPSSAVLDNVDFPVTLIMWYRLKNTILNLFKHPDLIRKEDE